MIGVVRYTKCPDAIFFLITCPNLPTSRKYATWTRPPPHGCVSVGSARALRCRSRGVLRSGNVATCTRVARQAPEGGRRQRRLRRLPVHFLSQRVRALVSRARPAAVHPGAGRHCRIGPTGSHVANSSRPPSQLGSPGEPRDLAQLASRAQGDPLLDIERQGSNPSGMGKFAEYAR